MAVVARKWRTSEDAGGKSEGLIGPNAILQMLPVIEQLGGPARVTQMLARAGVPSVPDGRSMIPETQAARLHQQVRLEEPDKSAELTSQAGCLTADYILANRIPKLAQVLLRALPPKLAAHIFSGAVVRHAWTFTGSGRFCAVTPWCFEIEKNPLIAGELSDHLLCHWHAAVFQTLYQKLVHPDCYCTEERCGAQGGKICRFVLRIGDP